MAGKPLPTILQEAIAEFSAWWNDVRDRSDIADTVTSPRFHYANSAGLTGIVTNEEIWLTSILHLNDPSEFAHGMSLATEMMRERAPNEHEVVQFFFDGVLENIPRVEAAIGFYVASFSSDGDDLGQWRAYGDNGRGYALGLSPDLFRRVHLTATVDTPPNETIFVASVIYDEREAKQRQKDVIGKAVETVNRFVDADVLRDRGNVSPFLERMATELVMALIWNAITTKHPAYKNEQETRLILINGAEKLESYVKTRVRGSEIIPYIPHKMKLKASGAITGIVVGPAAAPQAVHGVESLLSSLGIKAKGLVTQSTIPYRC